MKKIYILTAVFALLTLSLNAQDGNLKTATDMRLQTSSKTVKDIKAQQTPTLNELVRGIKGMSSVLQAAQAPHGSTNNAGGSRAPFRLNAGEELMGPFTTYDTSVSDYTSYGWGNAYGDNYQQIYIFADLDRSAFEGHDGDEIVGYRFALGGNTSQTAVVYDFMAWPYSTNGYFEAANRHTWRISEAAGAEPITTFDDLVITVPNYYSMFKSITLYDQDNNVLDSWTSSGTTSTVTSSGTTYTYYEMPDGWTLSNVYMFQYGSSGNYYGYLSNDSEASITIDSSILEGSTSVRVEIVAMGYQSGQTITIGNDTRTLTTSDDTYSWNISPTGTATPIYQELQAGQWYEYYLDEPIPFNVADSIDGMYLGYRFFQYPSTETSELLYPVAINPNSNTAGIVTNRYGQSGTTTAVGDITITLPSTYTNIRSITVTSGNTTITSYSYANNGGTLPENWSMDGTIGLRYDYSNVASIYSSDGTGYLTLSSELFEGYNSVTVSIYFSTSTRNQTATVGVNGTNKTTTSRTGSTQTWTVDGSTVPVYTGGWWTENITGDLAVQLIFKKDNVTPAPVITYEVNGDNVVITATGEGTVKLTVGNETQSGTGSVSITVPRTDTTYSVTATATAQDGDKEESDPATETITVPFLQTNKPVITYETVGENVVITATGDGTVTLTIGDQTVTDEDGSASITVPCGVVATTVTATATAQETGKAVSETETAQVPIPAGEGWLVMDGDYTNPNTLLSFEVDGEEIMMIDQFLASTKFNTHPNGYTYTLRETIDGEEKSSTPVNIPVYKDNSSIQGLYTKSQVDTDLKMGLRANVINSEMDYDVNPDHNTLYHSLYRGEVNADYPVIDVQHRVSQLQKYDENVNDNVQYFFTEMHSSGIIPRYDQLGAQIVERLDTNWVACEFGQEISYVPVIWTFGLYTGRDKGDGKNNSYGSDIKREKLGAVTISIEGKHSDGSAWGKYTYNGQEYCIYHPVINIEGSAPVTVTSNDGDVSTYVPYMYRAWCTYDGMRDFTRIDGVLADNGPLAAPYLLGEEVTTSAACHIGENWAQNSGRLQSAFAVPVGVPDDQVTFVVRFYYKKTVAEGQSNGNMLRLGNGEDEEYYIVQAEGDGEGMVTGISELMNGATPVSVTYINMQGMKSDQPFDGVNIVVTRYSDGTTVTSKVVR